MKRLTVLRHAKARWDDPALDDFNRPLNDRGWKAARRVGSEMTRRGCTFDLVLASPAARVRETLDAIEGKFRFTAPIKFDERMYLATEELLLALVRELPETVHRPLLVGHNPGLQQLLLELSTSDHERHRDRVQHKFPTGAFAMIELPAHRWERVEPKIGKIVDLIVPKDL